MFRGGSRVICMIYHVFPGLHLFYTYPAQHLITAGSDLDTDPAVGCLIGHDLSYLSDVYTVTVFEKFS